MALTPRCTLKAIRHGLLFMRDRRGFDVCAHVFWILSEFVQLGGCTAASWVPGSTYSTRDSGTCFNPRRCALATAYRMACSYRRSTALVTLNCLDRMVSRAQSHAFCSSRHRGRYRPNPMARWPTSCRKTTQLMGPRGYGASIMRVTRPSRARSSHAQPLVDDRHRWMRISQTSFISTTSSSYRACIAGERGRPDDIEDGRRTFR